jgi:RND family efflux transporter MFP subunit
MNDRKASGRWKRWLLIPILAAGVAVLVYQARVKQGPERREAAREPRAVRVVEARELDVVPRATGYGEVKPSTIWRAIAQVNGQVLELHPDLEKGAVLEPDRLLARIDPKDYELAIAEAEAELESVEAERKQLQVEKSNTQALLKIERRRLKAAERQYRRMQKLFAANSISRSALDKEEQSLLAQRKQVQSLENSLSLIPARRAVLEARAARLEAQLAQARRNLERTEIRLPMRARISEVNVEKRQYVRTGEVLLVAHGMERVEINAQIPIGRFRHLVSQLKTAGDADFAPRRAIERLGATALVRLEAGELRAQWPARLARVSETLDPETRTIGAIVEVDDPYERIVPGVRPPLINGMYVEVELRTRPLPGRIVVPRSAVHGSLVYVSGPEDRLHKRPVEVRFAQGGIAVLESGLKPGELVVVSDLTPAVEGMKLITTRDAELENRLAAEARAEVPLQ